MPGRANGAKISSTPASGISNSVAVGSITGEYLGKAVQKSTENACSALFGNSARTRPKRNVHTLRNSARTVVACNSWRRAQIAHRKRAALPRGTCGPLPFLSAFLLETRKQMLEKWLAHELSTFFAFPGCKGR